MRNKRLIYFFIVAAVAVVAAMCYFANHVNQTMRNAYAVWWVAGMVVDHMIANDGQWPENWEDLRDDYQSCVQRSGQPWPLDELMHRVRVDWDVDPRELTNQQSDGVADFRVIWLADGSRAYWAGEEPNQIILDYLNQRGDFDH